MSNEPNNFTKKFGRIIAAIFWLIVIGCGCSCLIALTIKLVSWILGI